MAKFSPYFGMLSIVLAIYCLPAIMQILALHVPPLGFLMDSTFYFHVMEFYRSDYPESEPVPIQEIHANDLTEEIFLEMTKSVQYPIVIRGGLPFDKIEKLGKRHTWATEYSKDSDWMVCSDNGNTFFRKCKPKEIVDDYTKNETVRPDMLKGQGSHFILYNNPDLINLLETKISDWIPKSSSETTHSPVHEIFFAAQGTNTPLHGAMRTNLVKQVAGRKKWTLVDPAYAFITGLVGNEKNFGTTIRTNGDRVLYHDSEWLKKVPRVQTILDPGDFLLIPPWWAHTIENMATTPSSELTIGIPETYAYFPTALYTSPFFTINAVIRSITHKSVVKMHDIMDGTTTKNVLHFLPLHKERNAEAFDNYIIDDNILQSTVNIGRTD
jgi:hypothetical protein